MAGQKQRDLDPMIGLEIHVQLTNSPTKLFCQCKAEYRQYPPNTNICPVCLGMPGALPVVQPVPLIYAVAASYALGCKPNPMIIFTRKHYYYPDLPKNYQITEFEGAHGAPVCKDGLFRYLDPNTWEWKSVRIRRINLEEDPGRSTYDKGGITRSPFVHVDYNRSGVPLLEIVTEPDLRSPREARALVEYLLLTLEYMGVMNPRLEGAFRVDSNISVGGGERVEVKNIGSTLDVEKAIRYEILRQSKIIETGGVVTRETRHWDSVKGITVPLRHKEEEEEYLYFPDPDLPPVPITPRVKRQAAELLRLTPADVYRKITGYGVKREIAWSITLVPALAKLYLRTASMAKDRILAAKLVGVDLKGELKEKGIEHPSENLLPKPDTIARLVNMVTDKELPYDTVKGIVLPRILDNPNVTLDQVIPKKASISEDLIIKILKENRRAVCDYLQGKKKALNYLVGVVIRTLGKVAVDPRELRNIIEKTILDNKEYFCENNSVTKP